jgi:hypothetical protein
LARIALSSLRAYRAIGNRESLPRRCPIILV